MLDLLCLLFFEIVTPQSSPGDRNMKSKVRVQLNINDKLLNVVLKQTSQRKDQNYETKLYLQLFKQCQHVLLHCV